MRQLLAPVSLNVMHHSHTSPRNLSYFLAALAAVFMSCEPNMTVTNNSSEGQNDYFEEPLSEYSERFEVALNSSNELVQLLFDRDYSTFAALAAEPLRAQVDDAKIKELMESIIVQLGPPIEYKPMQWAFTTRSENGRDVVYSTKIVVHEKTQAYYYFKFDVDGDQKKYELFHISGRRGTERIGTAINRVFDRYDSEA